jgi:nucleotide-binding universal stress UspA family protein
MTTRPVDAPAQPGVRYDNVIVPIDGSDRSAIALRTGEALAQRFGATLHTVSVAVDPFDLSHLRVVAAAALAVERTDCRVHTVLSDELATAIASLADELGPSVVCMSTHARDRLAGAVVGSAAREVLHVTSQPVVMVGPLADRALYMGNEWATPLAIDRLVVCVTPNRSDRTSDTADLVHDARTLVEIGSRWAFALGMSLTVLHVEEPVITTSSIFGNGGIGNWMVHLADQASAHGIDVDVHVEVDPIGTVAGVRSYLVAHPAGLLVVSTHAREGIDRIVHGATAAGITEASTIATLVVPISHPHV